MSTPSDKPTSAQLAAAEARELFDLIDQTVAGITDEEIERRLREVLRAARMAPPGDQV